MSIRGHINRTLERSHPDARRLDRLVELNHGRMAGLLATVEHEQPGGDFVVVLRAGEEQGDIGITVYRREVVLRELADRPLEDAALREPVPDGCFHALVGTPHVMEVRVLARAGRT